MRTYKIALGRHEGSNAIKNVERTWAQIVERLSAHQVSAKKGGAYFIGGHFSGNVRDVNKMIGRSLLCLDIDSYTGDIDMLEFDLTLWLSCAFIAYSSYRHTADAPRIRVVIPMSRELSPKEYGRFAKSFCETASIPIDAFDACSWKANQPMFLPQHPDGVEGWTLSQDGNVLSVPDYIEIDDAGANDDLETMIVNQPLEISDDEISSYLAAYPAKPLVYDEWLKVGMGLWHQYQGADTGLRMWLDWSRQDAERFDERGLRAKWKSFGAASKPVTMASLIWRVKERGGIESVPSAFDDLLTEAAAVSTLGEYDALKKKVQSMPSAVLPPVRRGLLVQAVAEGFGKAQGIGKVAIKKELDCSKPAAGIVEEPPIVPDWSREWVYIEAGCAFANVDVPDYTIKREAFNAKYDRMPECVSLEKHAADACLVNFDMKTVADAMFYPGAEQFFEYEGKTMINGYRSKGVVPCDVMDADGQSVVDAFLAHVDLTIEREEEQRILIDWLAYIYQNPGKRVSWALFLQGAQGIGKTYFGTMLQELMGSNVRQLDTSAISGRFTGWAHGSLVTVVEEIRIASASKWEIIDKLKPIISNRVIQIEEKGRDHRTVPNFTSYFLLSNHIDAIPIVAGDRRYCCILSRIQTEQQLFEIFGGRELAKQYFDKLFAETQRRADALARFLMDWKVSDHFDPTGRAPDTSAKAIMQNLTVSPESDLIEDAIARHQCEIINDDIVDLTWLNQLVEGDGGALPKKRAISAILVDLGYRPISIRRVKIQGGEYHYIWTRGAQSENSIKSKVRDFHAGRKVIDDENFKF